MLSCKLNYKIQWHQIDAKMELRPFSFMNMAQELANNHADIAGFGYETLIKHNYIWVLSRMDIKIINPPKWGDDVTVETWHKGKRGLFWARDFEMKDREGNVLLAATSMWVIMNTQTRRIERRAAIEDITGIHDCTLERDAIAESCDKINTPADLEFVREHKVMYSDIDFNLHANNAKYIEWVMDSISIEELKEYKVKDIRINYNLEARFNDTIIISKKELENNTLYIQGERDNHLIFQTLIEREK